MKLTSIIVSLILSGSPGLSQRLSNKKHSNDLISNFKVGSATKSADLQQHQAGQKSLNNNALTRAKRSLVAQWLQTGQDIDGEFEVDESGAAVSISDNGQIVAVGAANNDGNSTGISNNQGHVRVYQWNGSQWVRLGNDIDGVARQSYAGYALSLSGNGLTLSIGAPRYDENSADEKGRTIIYRFNGSDWVPYGLEILGTDDNDQSGHSVSLSTNGEIVAIGAPNHDMNRGQVRVFEMANGNWVQRGFGDIDGDTLGDNLGYSVSLSSSGSRVAVGATKNDSGGQDSGQVRVYEWNGTAWTQLGIDINGESTENESGYSVSLNAAGDVVAIGAPKNYNTGNATLSDFGHVRVYKYESGTWTQRGSDIDGQVVKSLFGHSVSISNDGNRVAVGAPEWQSMVPEEINRGRVQVYNWESGGWVKLGQDLDGEENNDHYGSAVAMSGDGRHVANGAHYNGGPDGTTTNIGHVRVFEIDGLNDLVAPGGGGGESYRRKYFRNSSSYEHSSSRNIVPSLTFALQIYNLLDPHFRSFNGGFFSFHGQCDMVLMKSLGFASGRGLDVHIRTTRIDNSQFSYSYISGIAVKLGDAVVEVMTDGGLIVNGEEAELSGERTGVAGILLTSTVKGANKNIIVHDLALSEDISIQIRANTKTGMLFIDVNGMFSDSIGLLGSTEGMFARDGETDMAGFWNALGEEWQVRKTEPKLFLDTHREPQHPAGCLYAGAAKRKAHLRRRLTDDLADEVNIEVATKACAKLSGELRDFCITDIMATGDLELAEDPFYS